MLGGEIVLKKCGRLDSDRQNMRYNHYETVLPTDSLHHT